MENKLDKKKPNTFCITSFCKCKCGNKVSPSQVSDISQILYDGNKEKVIGFRCWRCEDWIAFPKVLNQ